MAEDQRGPILTGRHFNLRYPVRSAEPRDEFGQFWEHAIDRLMNHRTGHKWSNETLVSLPKSDQHTPFFRNESDAKSGAPAVGPRVRVDLHNLGGWLDGEPTQCLDHRGLFKSELLGITQMLQNATSTDPKGGTTRIYSIGGVLEDLLSDAQRVLPFPSDRLDLYGFPG